MFTSTILVWSWVAILAGGAALDGGGKVSEVPNFALLDQNGRFYELRRAEGKVVVLFFTANGCPVARKSLPALKDLRGRFAERGVEIWLVNSSPADDRESIQKEAREFPTWGLPVLVDETQGVAAVLGVKRTGTAVAIETDGWRIIYQGALDDRLAEGAEKDAAREHFLAKALEEFLAGKAVEKPRTAAHGCLLTIWSRERISYAREIAPVLERKCLGCHSPGCIGPIKFTNYRKVRGNADMIQEVLLARRMPPWHADRHDGAFANDFSLSLEETRLLLRWIEQGADQDGGEDPLERAAAPSREEWPLGRPDAVVALPKVEEIPATGVFDYRHILTPAPFDDDVWLRGVVAKPDNARVVHHIIVRVREPGQKENRQDEAFLLGWAPGSPEMLFPEGTGKFLKKGSTLEFEMHYTASGRPEKDQSRIGLYLMKEKPRLELKTRAAYNRDFEITPGEPSENTFATYVFTKDSLLFDMSPHMHLRGLWFKFEALYPSGRRETLLSVPRYDFKWQHIYRLREPKRMPAGTWILCSGGFDNSARNPSNPNSKVPVRWGDQSFDEMFIGFMDVAEISESADAVKPVAVRSLERGP